MIDGAANSVVDAVVASLAQAKQSPDGVAAAAAILWTDADGQWEPLIESLQRAMPQLFVLGVFAPEERRGPVIWLRCVVERALPDVSVPEGVVPILYLPKVSRQDLRAAGDCRAELLPLIELQYRGTCWHQRNGRDWTVEAFLTSADALALDVAKDTRTLDAMLRCLPLLGSEPVSSLKGRRLEADDFDQLVVGDPVRDLLSWLSDVEAFRSRCDAARWAAFRDVTKRQFALDPDQGGTQAAGDALLCGGGKWDAVWKRFCEAPRLYPGVSAVLRKAQPKDLFSDAAPRRPVWNEEQDGNLRKALEAAVTLPHLELCLEIAALDQIHGERRGWVWAELGESPYAMVLEPLGRLAKAAKTALGGTTAEAMAADYVAHGWRCDRAAVEALTQIKREAERDLICRVVRALYEPWLDRSARRYQELLSERGINPANLTSAVNAERDTCVLFADGLRFDVGATLQERLEARGLRVRMSCRVSPIPTVTATAKPVASPAHSACAGRVDAGDFAPSIASTGQIMNASRLRDAMAGAGVEVLDLAQSGMALGGEGGGWTEAGKLDMLGHSLDAVSFAHQIESETGSLIERIMSLLGAGWARVRVVTDHGWLLLPGGLPKVVLSPHLVATKWARCAAVKGQSTPEIPTYPWYWNPIQRIASPPGIGAFTSNAEYAHGGVSVQECVVPDMVVERGEEAVSAVITGISWRGMRCRVNVRANRPGVTVDLRLNWKQGTSSIVAAVKKLTAGGEVSLAVSDDKHEGTAASVVVSDGEGRVLDYKPTTVGEDK